MFIFNHATKLALSTVFATLLGFSATAAQAEYPEKPINMIIGFKTGGGTDLAGRALAKELQDILGQPIAVVNKPGAASMVSAATVAKARPDGYTVWFGSAGTLILKETMGQSKAKYGEDLKLAALTGRLVSAVGVPAGSPFKSVQNIIDAAKKEPGKLRWSHNGKGAAFMMMGQGFISANELDVVGIPFQGAKGLRQALAAGKVDFGILNAGDRLRLGDKKFTLLAAIADDRDMVLDDQLPTMKEQEIAYTEIASPLGLMVPAGVPDEVTEKLAAAIAEVVKRESFAESMKKLYQPVVYMNAEDGNAFIEELRTSAKDLLAKTE